MTTVLPDWGVELGKSIGQALSGIARIKDPDLDFHEKFRQAITTNPEILDNLAGEAFLNNGQVASSHLIPRDVLAQVQKRASKGNVSPEFIKKKAAQDVVHASSPTQLHPPGGYTQQEWWDLGRAANTGESVGGAASGLATAPHAAAVADAQAKNTLDEASLQGDQRAALYSYLTSHPQDREAILAMGGEQGLRFIMQLQKDKEMVQLRNDADMARFNAEQTSIAARYNAERLGGNFDDWKTYMTSPDTMTKIHERAARGELSEDDQRLLDIEHRAKSRDTRWESITFHRIWDNINSLSSNLLTKHKGRKLTPGLVGGALTAINIGLNEYHGWTGTRIQAFWGDLYKLGAVKMPKKQGPFTPGFEEDYTKNTLHYVLNPGTPEAKVLTPDELGLMMESDAQGKQTTPAPANSNNGSPQPSRPAAANGTTQIGPTRPATQVDMLRAKESRWNMVNDSLTKAGVPKDSAARRATAIVEALFK